MAGGGNAQCEQGRVVFQSVGEIIQQPGQCLYDGPGGPAGVACGEAAQRLVAEEGGAVLAGAGLGEAVGVEQEGVAGAQGGGGGGEVRGGQDADEQAARGGQEVGGAVGAQDERWGWPPEARWMVACPLATSDSMVPKMVVQ